MFVHRCRVTVYEIVTICHTKLKTTTKSSLPTWRFRRPRRLWLPQVILNGAVDEFIILFKLVADSRASSASSLGIHLFWQRAAAVISLSVLSFVAAARSVTGRTLWTAMFLLLASWTKELIVLYFCLLLVFLLFLLFIIGAFLFDSNGRLFLLLEESSYILPIYIYRHILVIYYKDQSGSIHQWFHRSHSD